MASMSDKLPTQGEVDAKRLAVARALLARPRRIERTWPALAAALCFAASATAFATVTILAPAPQVQHGDMRK